MRTLLALIGLELLWLGPWIAPAWPDGGAVQLVERQGDYQLSVFTAPNPLRAGPIDISVLVQNAETGQPIGDVDTVVHIRPVDGQGTPIVALATTETATNKLLQSALIDLPAPGGWQVHVECATAGGKLEARFAMTAGPPLPRWLSQWPWFAWPVVAVLVFAVHRCLVTRRQQGRTTSAAPVCMSAAAPGVSAPARD